MYIDKLIKKEVITLLISVAFLVVVFIGVTFAKFLSVDKGQKTVINMGDLNISFCNNSTCDTTYSNIGQVIGTKVENGVTVPASIYPFKNDGTYSNETPYIFKVENTGTLDSTVKIKLKEDATYTPTGDYSSYTRLSLKYPEHLKVAIKKKVLYEDTGYQLGDVNLDGIVNEKDHALTRKMISGSVEFNDVQKKLADLNLDGRVTILDLGRYTKMFNGSIDTDYSPKVYTYTDLEDGVIFKDDIIGAGDSATYFLWLYLDESTPNDVQNTFFVGNIDVVGEFIPKINPVSFSTDTWETISTAVKEGNISRYKVGDTKEIDMGDYGTHTLRIANTSTPSECSTSGFSQTACGFVLEFADIITTHKMNDTNTNVGGWPATSMRTFVNNDIYNAIPSEIKNAIIDTTVVSGHGSEDTANFTSTDKLYLLSTAEVWADAVSSSNGINGIDEKFSILPLAVPEVDTCGVKCDNARNVTRQLDYYKNLGTTPTNYSGAIKKNGTSADYWWLRAAKSTITSSFYRVSSSGHYSQNVADTTNGVSPAFRIG